MIELSNDQLCVEVDTDLGAEIRAVRTTDGRNALADFDWESPTPVGRGQSYGSSELDWLSAYRGGWQETVPNAGQDCIVDGLPMGFHGHASRTRWEVAELDADRCLLTCPSRLPLVIERRMQLAADRSALQIDGSVRNLGRRDVEIVWGQHPAFPAVPGAALDLPPGGTVHHDPGRPSDLWPQESSWPQARNDHGAVDLSATAPEGTHRLLYVTGQRGAWAALRQPDPYVSVALAWDGRIHPFIWLWSLRGTGEFPWYGRASVVSIEAQAAWPYDGLAGARERGQALTVPAGGVLQSWYTISLLPPGTPPVTEVYRDGSVSVTSASADPGHA